MFSRCNENCLGGRDLKRKNMLCVMRDTGGIAVPPLGKYFEKIALSPIFERILASNDAGFFLDLTRRRFDQAFFAFLATGDRLPVARMCRALKEQHLQFRCVDDHEDGDGALMFFHGVSERRDEGALGSALIFKVEDFERDVTRLPFFDNAGENGIEYGEACWIAL